jgi:glucose/arabinose dehydrogenase
LIEDLEPRRLLAVFVPPGFSEQPVLSGLNFPTAVEFAPGGAIFVAERAGVIKCFSGERDQSPTSFNLDPAPVPDPDHPYVLTDGDRGLNGLALHPNFAQNHYVYTFFSKHFDEAGADGAIIMRFTAVPNGNRYDLSRASAVTLKTGWFSVDGSHNNGNLMFGPDGMLYAGCGDGTNPANVDVTSPLPTDIGPGAPHGALKAQALRAVQLGITGNDYNTSLAGSIIRINPDTGEAAPGNPVDYGDGNARSIIAFGMRNPFRFGFRGSSELFVGDVGWNTWEEINRIGLTGDFVENGSWPAMEGDAPVPGYDLLQQRLVEDNLDFPGITPYFQYKHGISIDGEDPAAGASVTGIAFNSGGGLGADYDGAMFFADYARQAIFVVKAQYLNDATITSTPNAVGLFESNTQTRPVELEIHNGALYYVDIGNDVNQGDVYAITTGSGGPIEPIDPIQPVPGPMPHLVVTPHPPGHPTSAYHVGDRFDFTVDVDVHWDLKIVHLGHPHHFGGDFGGDLHFTDPDPEPGHSHRQGYFNIRDHDQPSHYELTVTAFDGGAQAVALLTPARIPYHFAINGLGSVTAPVPMRIGVAGTHLEFDSQDDEGSATIPAGGHLVFSAEDRFEGSDGNGYAFVSWTLPDGTHDSDRIQDFSTAEIDPGNTQNWVANYQPVVQHSWNPQPYTTGQQIPAVGLDSGGEGAAYHDTGAINSGPDDTYRHDDGIDTFPTSDPGGSANHVVTFTRPGEWFEFTIHVSLTRRYRLLYRTANRFGDGTFKVGFRKDNGPPSVFDDLPLPQTGGFDTFQTSQTAGTLQLGAGDYVMRVEMKHPATNGYFGSFNWFRLNVVETVPIDEQPVDEQPVEQASVMQQRAPAPPRGTRDDSESWLAQLLDARLGQSEGLLGLPVGDSV